MLVNPARQSVMNDDLFKSIAVTAEQWLPIREVPPAFMKVYLHQKQLEGYLLVGLEQSTNSTHLQHFTFPPKVVLVPGDEKRGIPTDVLRMLDYCVEIPQFGLVRSLNVHVSSSILLWEFTRQGLLAGRVRAPVTLHEA
jgi:tRNA guanosine-2'-O-methyltransferase